MFFSYYRVLYQVTAINCFEDETVPQHITLNGLLWRKEDKGQNISLLCTFSEYYPKGINVTWKEGTQEVTYSAVNKEFRSVGNGTTGFTLTSILKVDPEKWYQGLTYTCSTTHDAKILSEKISICSAYPIPSPSVYLEKPKDSADNKILATCTVFAPRGTTILWLLDDEHETGQTNTIKHYANGTQSLITKHSITMDKWNTLKKITCRAQHPCFNLTEDTVSLAELESLKPTIKFLSFSDAEKTGSISLICMGSGFNPKITWQNSSGNVLVPTRENAVQHGELITVTSETEIKLEEWNKGNAFICELTDRPSQTKVKKEISKCTAIQESSRRAIVFLLGPSLEDKLTSSNLHFTCHMVANNIQEFSITWKVNGKIPSEQANTTSPKDNNNSTHTVHSVLTVKRSDWEAYRPVSCHVKHFCSSHMQNVSLKKTEEEKLRQPTLQLFGPSDAKLSETSSATLLCLILDFFPADIKVHWEMNGTKMDPSQYSNSPAVWLASAGSYSMHSKVLVAQSQWQEGKYSCIVSHESSQAPLTRNITNAFASLIPSVPKAKLFWSLNELVCLVYGFSPAAINITWLLNGNTELLDYNTTAPSRGPDGKFIIRSHLSLSMIPKAIYTCKVTHITKTLLPSISQQQITDEYESIDMISNDLGLQDNALEIWTTTCTFLALFLISFMYSAFLTFTKVK